MSETAHGKYGTDNYAVIPLLSATQVGLEMTLTIIRDVAAGLAVKVEHLPPAAFVEAAEVARAYDIPLVKRAIPKITVKVFASDPYGLLAIMVACADASVAGRKRAALASGYAFNMPAWARETLAAHAPATLVDLMEMQLRHHAARETITAEIDDTISKVWYSSCSRKKCREDIRELVKTELRRLEVAVKAVPIDLEFGKDGGHVVAYRVCYGCSGMLERAVKPLIQRFDAIRGFMP